MPLPGGDAGKAGDRYELRWTVRQFIRLLTGDADWIHLEPIGPAGEKVEFQLGRGDGGIEAHQVKRQLSGKGHWTVADLGRVGVLEGICRHTVEGDAEFVFVSTQAPKSLQELRHRALSTEDEGFTGFQASLTLMLTGDFDDLKDRLGNASIEQAWRALRHSRWHTQDEQGLGDTVLALLNAYLTGDPQAALGVLALFALDSVHRRIRPQQLWDVLRRHDIHPCDVAHDENLVVRRLQCQEDYLQSQAFGIGDLVLPRTEAQMAASSLLERSGRAKTLFLVGPAGMGKTGAAGQIVQRISGSGWLVLPFRLDRLDPTHRPAEIGRQLLGLEKSPVALLAGLAANEPCLLVIEQLDAVSVVSGRRPEMFDAVASMVREARAHPNLHLLLVCRTFDLENDHRLRELRVQEKERTISISIDSLAPEQVREVAAHLGLSPKELSASQVDLLRFPLHLSLLASVIRERPDRQLHFSSAKDLFDAFWRRKHTDLLPVLSDQNAFETLLHGLCGAMNDRQTLSIPRGLLPPGDADLSRLVAAQVLIRQGSRIGFFHEGFFDYVFARRFCEMGETLLEFLRSANEQDLFRRSQVRQILAYRRDDDFDAYIHDLCTCLDSPDIRFHMKKLMIGLVAQIADPRSDEWTALEAHLQERTGGPADPVRGALWSSIPWFRFLLDQGVLSAWLESDRPEIRDFAFNWLGRSADKEPDRVADLLEGMAGRSPKQDERILGVVTWHGAAAASQRIEDLFYRLASNPGRDWSFTKNAYHRLFDHCCYGPRADVRVACRALGRWLRLLATDPVRIKNFAHNLESRDVIEEHQFAELAKDAPDTLISSAIEPLVDLIEREAVREGETPYEDRIWHQGFRELTHWVPEALLISLVDALKQCATSSPDLFLSALERLRASDCRTAHAILLRALAVKGGRWKSYAVDYLMETWFRWGIWFGNQARWDCRCLLQTLAPELDEQDVSRIEPWFLGHYEQWQPSGIDESEEGVNHLREFARRFRWFLGQEQYELLSALPSSKLTLIGKRRLSELTRKASSLGWQLEKPHRTRGGTVISPLPELAVARMTDAQWLSAIRRYTDDTEKQWLEDRILGGARQLARSLEKQTKAYPERFARLMLSIPDDANEHYFQAIVMGLKDCGLLLSLLEQVVERAHNRPERPHGRWIPPLIASHVEKDLSVELLSVVAWYATEDSDPTEDIWQQETDGNGKYYGGDPHTHGINTARGTAAGAIAVLIARDRRYWEYFAPVLEPMVEDPSISVRTCVAETCIQVLRHDRPRAITLFLKLCDADDELLATRPIENFLYYTTGTELERVRPVLERMLASPNENARQAAARQSTVAAMSEEAARPLVDIAINGDPVMRTGVVQILCTNIIKASEQNYCHTLLVRLFDDIDEGVRREANNWTREVWKYHLIRPVLPVAEAFVGSQSFFLEGASDFFRCMEKVTDAPPDLIFRAGQRFVELAGTATGNLAGTHAHTAERLSNLILRAYRQAEQDVDLRRRCLNLFDLLLEVGGHGADEAIGSFER